MVHGKHRVVSYVRCTFSPKNNKLGIQFAYLINKIMFTRMYRFC